MKITLQAEMEMVHQLEHCIKDLARQREMILKTGIMSEEEITDFINENGEKYGNKYRPMNPFELFFDLLKDADEARRRKHERNAEDDI